MVDRGHQGREVHAQSRSQPTDVHEADVPDAPLYVADVARVQPSCLRKCLLGQATARTERSNGGAEGNEQGVAVRARHRPTLRTTPPAVQAL